MLIVPEKVSSTCWILGLSVILALGCQVKPPGLVPKFEKGEIVVSALTGEKLMVMYLYVGSTDVRYTCRIGNAIPIERDGVLSADTVSSRYATKWFYEYELRKAKED